MVGGGGGGRTSELDEQDSTEFQLMKLLHEIPSDDTSGNSQARQPMPSNTWSGLYDSSPSAMSEGRFGFYGGLSADQNLVTNGKQSYASNIGYEDGSKLPDEKSLALAFEGLGFKDGVVSEATNPHACNRPSPGCNFMNNVQPPFAMDTLGMVIPQLHGQRRETLSSDLADQHNFPVYTGAMPTIPGTCQSLLTRIDSRSSPYQHQLPLPNVADSLRRALPYQQHPLIPNVADSLRGSPYQQQFDPFLMSSHHLREVPLPTTSTPNGSELLQYGNYMDSAVSPLNGRNLTQSFYGIPSYPDSYWNGNALCKRYGQLDLSKMGGNSCQYQPKGESLEFSCRPKAKFANGLLDCQTLDKFKNHCFPEKILTRSYEVNSLTYRNRSASFGNNNGRTVYNSDHNPFISNVASKLDCRNSLCHSPDCLDAKSLDSKFDSVDSVKGKIYSLAKDPYGCHFLQSKFTIYSPEDIGKIYDEIIDHIVELMTNPFGNYLVQNLIEICNEDQRMHILHAITREPGVLIRIACNMHGTRVVQKVIETLQTTEQISVFVNSLKQPGIVSLIKDINGNHVAQHCLMYFSPEFKEFLYEAAISHCTELAVDRQGCCVLQKCIRHSEGVWKNRIVSKICSNSDFLSPNAFGNYAVQYVLEQNISWATTVVLGQLEGSYEKLSTDKYASNVVEKCLYRASDEQREKIVNELMNSPRFLQIMLDPYGNYVIKSALRQCKGTLYFALVGAIRPHTLALRSNKCGKRVMASIR